MLFLKKLAAIVAEEETVPCKHLDDSCVLMLLSVRDGNSETSFYVCVAILLWNAVYKQATFVGSFKTIKLNDSLFSTLFLSLSLIFSCPCAVSLLCSLICGLSLILCLFLSFFSPFLFLWGCGWKPSLFYVFFRGRWIFQFCIFSLFMCSLFFPGPFDVSVDSLSFRLDELTDADARALACSCAHTTCTHALTLSFYTRDQRHPHASTDSSLFVSLFHALLHPHHCPYNS